MCPFSPFDTMLSAYFLFHCLNDLHDQSNKIDQHAAVFHNAAVNTLISTVLYSSLNHL